jgi:hypothetical protein
MPNINVLFAAAGLAVAMSTVGVVHAQGMEKSMEPGMMPGASDRAQCMSMMRDGMSNMSSGKMEQHMGGGMMGGGANSGMGTLFGSRVRPVMNLSVDDVRGYLDTQLERLNNKRLKVGDVKADDTTITADIVTVDNSLVQRLKVDRHTGAIGYES